MRSRTTRLLLAATTFTVCVESISVTPYSRAAEPFAAPLSLRPCHIDGLAEEILCGAHNVFEDRHSGSGRRLAIQVAVLPALKRNPQPDPLFLMAGGPGQGARGMAPIAARYFRQVRRDRHIVLVDLRGTGASHPLRCSKDEEIAAINDVDAAGMARRCAQQLDADPRFYTHRESLADLDEIRARLGYTRVNLWGGSWGTRAALLYAVRYPAHTRSVILDGAVALTMGFPRTASADAQAALGRAIADCSADRDCHAAFPAPEADLDRFVARFTAGDVSITFRHPRTSVPTAVTLSRGVAMDIIRGALYVPKDAATVMHLVRQAADGDFAPLMAQFVRTASVSTDDMALATTMAVLCSEDLPTVAHADFARDAAGSTFGTTYADAWRSRCDAWPLGQRVDEAPDAVSQAPALILSGGHDPVTPPRAGESMARHFPRHRHVVVANAAHNASFAGCVPRLIAEFLAVGHGDALDDQCTAAITWPPFVVSASGTQP